MGGEPATCVEEGGSCDANAFLNEDEVDLIQTRMHIAPHKTTRPGTTNYKPYKMRPVLKYFQHWSSGAVRRMSRIPKQIKEQTPGGEVQLAFAAEITQASAALDEQQAVELLENHRVRQCPTSMKRSVTAWTLHDSDLDEAGVWHSLLQSQSGVLQYLAVHRGRLLVADPPVCSNRTASLLQPPKLQAEKPVLTGEEESIDPKSDPTVKDCIRLFQKTSQDKCGKEFEIDVKRAVIEVIDGLELEMNCNLKGKGGKTRKHQIKCEFETTSAHKDAELLQLDDMGKQDPVKPGGSESLPSAKIVMDIDICEADEKDSLSSEKSDLLSFMDKHHMGELSRYKGFAHVNDAIPRASASSLIQKAPDEYDISDKYPQCFPTLKEVVRNQGSCGSCWAFASASTTMTNLCVSGSGGALATPDDRYEVSVQAIMSCNSNAVGCDGGFAAAAAASYTAAGIAKEREFPYKCGGGDSLKHFEESSTACAQAPWGAACQSVPSEASWKWGSAAAFSGEEDFMKIVSTGAAMYVSFDVYNNFFSLGKDEVYSSTSGGKAGGHAVTLVGYGLKAGVKYWTIQNSWGPSWCDNGYAKFKRGVNLAGIEDDGFYLRSWVAGGEVPQCFEGVNSGLNSGGPIACSVAATGMFGNLCEHPSFGAMVKGNCPLSCNACEGISSGGGGGGSPAPPAPAADCTDDPDYRDPGFGDSCAGWASYSCDGFPWTDDLKTACPKACRMC